jgi:hypothetical protein
VDECVALREQPRVERIVAKLREADVGATQLRERRLAKQLGSVTGTSTEACPIARIFQQPEVRLGYVRGSRETTSSLPRELGASRATIRLSNCDAKIRLARRACLVLSRRLRTTASRSSLRTSSFQSLGRCGGFYPGRLAKWDRRVSGSEIEERPTRSVVACWVEAAGPTLPKRP